ncbi:hypothetical protein PLICRDRAFT_161745 [Plicaturopsis crispa FD-325 SS-3]|nr:hypothetical protein PLICRDRAFT_161745 [Plicaturopsis crispa FD-325 SS-3]
MSSDVLLEEYEVLESIYPTELEKISERDIRIDVEPDEVVDGLDELKLSLGVHYPDGYPDVLPDLSLDAVEGTLEDSERTTLLDELKTMGEDNIGMAMTFTLVSHLRERLASLVQVRAEEEARTRGTPVTVESFRAWKIKFDKELAAIKAREEEERFKGLSPKEREEIKRIATRPSGRQLFERDTTLEEDNLMEEGTVSVDFSQYERNRNSGSDDEDEGITFSDSD